MGRNGDIVHDGPRWPVFWRAYAPLASRRNQGPGPERLWLVGEFVDPLLEDLPAGLRRPDWPTPVGLEPAPLPVWEPGTPERAAYWAAEGQARGLPSAGAFDANLIVPIVRPDGVPDWEAARGWVRQALAEAVFETLALGAPVPGV